MPRAKTQTRKSAADAVQEATLPLKQDKGSALHPQRQVSTLLYFGYMAIMSLLFGLLTGSIGLSVTQVNLSAR